LAPERVVERAGNGDPQGFDAAEFTQILADLGGVKIHGPHETKGPPLDRGSDHLLPERPQPDVNNIDHRLVPSFKDGTF
jgi:hypothetical protein